MEIRVVESHGGFEAVSVLCGGRRGSILLGAQALPQLLSWALNGWGFAATLELLLLLRARNQVSLSVPASTPNRREVFQAFFQRYFTQLLTPDNSALLVMMVSGRGDYMASHLP